MSLLRVLPFAAASLLTIACGSSSDDPKKSTPQAKCDDDATTGVCVTQVTGSLMDESGAAVTNAPVSVCGDICYYGQSDGSGAFEVDVKAHIDLSAYFLLVHARPEKAGFYYKLPTDAPDTLVDAGSRLVLTLPASGSELSVSGSGAPAQSATSGDVTLDVPDGVDVKLDVEDVTAGPIGAEFRVLTVPDDERDTFVDPSLNVLALYAVAPFEATFLEKGSKTPAKASLTFTNTTGLAADTPVELLTMGSYYVDQNLAPGAFGPAATGHVSSDGASITLDPGEGVTYLTWFALREKK
ncbi:MAG: hypothetical protein H6717_42240 [Polyangiaceae bacterium]|nr:hypothetical protein [Polyangiaceae bacterium]